MTDAAYAGHRTDAAERRVELAWILAKHTDWATCTTRCGWALLADRGCVSHRTVARFLAWLRRERLLAVVSTGRTGVLVRPMALTPPTTAAPGALSRPGTPQEAAANEAAVYVLLEPVPPPRPYQPPDPGLVGLDPRYRTGELDVDDNGRAVVVHRPGPITTDDLTHPVDETGIPYGSPLVTSQHGRAPARTRTCTSCRRLIRTPLRVETGPPGLPSTNKSRRRNWHPAAGGETAAQDTGDSPGLLCARCHATRWARHTRAHTGADRLALADRLRHDAPPLTWVGTTRRLRWLLRDFLTAGWTVADVLHALDTHPNTGPYAYATSAPGTPGGLRNPAGWVLHRLRPWRQADGTPTAPFSATHTAQLTHQRAAQATDTHTSHRATAATAGPSMAYLAARAERSVPGGTPC